MLQSLIFTGNVDFLIFSDYNNCIEKWKLEIYYG